MDLKKWMSVSLLVSSIGCSQATEPTSDVEVSIDELAGQLGAKADGQDIRVLADGRIAFYNRAARELLELGEVSPRTRGEFYNGLYYAQSPFAYCVASDTDAACISYLPQHEIEGQSLTFGGRVTGSASVGAKKAYDMLLAMNYGDYSYDRVDGGLRFHKEGSPLSCTYQTGTAQCTVDAGKGAAAAELRIAFEDLPELGEGFVYEGWLIVDGAPVSAGRFDATDQFELSFDQDLTTATAYILTIEPAEGDDPAPSSTHLLGGEIVDGSAELNIAFTGALGTDFSTAKGGYILAAPTADDPAFGDKGIWFLDPTGAAGPASSLDLPELPEGWVYEGWVATENGPISTGRFRSTMGADSDGAGPAAGPGMAPPFPGQDFVNPPLSLPGNMAVISVEPSPDDSAAPFALKPLVGMIQDAGMGVPQALEKNGEALPTGRLLLQ